MTFTKSIIATLVATTVLAGAASAADDKKFDGSYAGIEAGVDWTKLGGDAKRDRGIYYGGVLGYRVQTDSNTVLGVEATLGDSGYKNNAEGINTDYEYGASLTLGQAFGADGANLVYGKAGYVRTRFDTDDADIGKYTDGGWRFGAGYERAINDVLSLRTEVDYTTYGNDTNQWTAKAGLLARF